MTPDEITSVSFYVYLLILFIQKFDLFSIPQAAAGILVTVK